MPRVHKKTKNRGGKKTYTCTKCHQPIDPGQSYYEWEFRYGGAVRQHASHGYPRQSQLTQSALQEVYAAIEDVEDMLATDEWTYDDLTTAVENVRDVAEEVGSQYEEAAQNFGNAGDNQERYEALDAYMSELDSLTIDEFEVDEDSEQSIPEQTTEWREGVKEAVEGALSALEL